MRDLRKAAASIEEKLKAKGVEKYAFTITKNRMEEFSSAGGEFTLLRTTFTESLVLTVFIDGKKGVKAGSDLSDDALGKAVEEAILSSKSADRDEAFDIAPSIGKIDIDRGDEEDTSLLFSRIRELQEHIAQNYPTILLMETVGQNTHYETIYRNSNGTDYRSRSGFYDCYIGYSAHEGERTTGMKYSSFMTKSLDKPFIELASVRSDLESTVRSLNAVSVGDKFTGDVIFTPSALNNFLYFFFASISDAYILQGVSPLRDKKGQKIADERITIRLESSNSNIVNGEMITSDGFRTEDTTIIENGILRNFYLSLYAANRTGNEVTKNTSSDIVMGGGDKTLQEIIKGTERGLLVGGFSGGRPSVNGDFSGVAKNSFYIENGEIKGAVTETMINGNILEMLKNVNAVSSERIKDGTSVMPYLCVRGIVISSK